MGGTLGGTLKVEVTAPPAGGAANEAVIELIARTLSMPRAAVQVVAGHSSRSKTVEITGLDPATVCTRLTAALP